MPHELNHAHVQSLIAERRLHITARDAADAKVRKLNEQLMQFLRGADLKRLQLVSSAVVQIMAPADRETIVGDRLRDVLLESGLKPDEINKVIAHATVKSPVEKFIRVDEPKVPKGAEIDAMTGALAPRHGEPAPAELSDLEQLEQVARQASESGEGEIVVVDADVVAARMETVN